MATLLDRFDPRDETWDAVVVGTGMGGGTVGHALARRGRKVLFLEKGQCLFGDHDRGDGLARDEEDERPEERLRKGRWPYRIEGETSFGPMRFFAPLGCGTGGSTSLYAAQLERMMPCDLEPRRHHPEAPESTLPERWPITYDQLLPHYREAERLYRVCGTADPLNPDPESSLAEPPAMSERDAELFDDLRRWGWHPYRAHVGYRHRNGCQGCGGELCPHDCKSDAGNVCVVPAVATLGARIVTEAEVVRLEASRTRVDRVVYRHRGEERSVRGKVVVLAAGALMTPALLLRSRSDRWPDGLANGSGQVGCNLMMHSSDLIAVQPRHRRSLAGPPKAISVNDLYLDGGVKMGTLQSVGMRVNPGIINYYLKVRGERDHKWYLQIGRVGRKLASYVGHALFESSAIMATIVEDLPYRDNRVELDPGTPNGMRFRYTYRQELADRNVRFHRELRRFLAGRLRAFPLFAGGNNLNFGHVSGTCRGGTDPATSVVDANNRSHELENLYVADSSTFPSSGGINPSLTIAARALMTAEAIDAAL